MMTKEDVKDLAKRLNELAQEVANEWYEYGGSVYQGPRLYEDSFSFQIGPSTHGIGTWITLPNKYIWDSTGMLDEVRRKKTEAESRHKESICKSCGHSRLQDWNNSCTIQ